MPSNPHNINRDPHSNNNPGNGDWLVYMLIVLAVFGAAAYILSLCGVGIS